ncbi:MAG: PIG-L family deacetylase [Saprospiraceae bacterium]|nr:PIG-L family deacetylase [Saprospiraceae bacterium]
MKLDILAIGIHPDDVELGCCGTLMRHAAMGKTFGILDLSAGELGTRGTPELRRQEAMNAAELLDRSSGNISRKLFCATLLTTGTPTTGALQK